MVSFAVCNTRRPLHVTGTFVMVTLSAWHRVKVTTFPFKIHKDLQERYFETTSGSWFPTRVCPLISATVVDVVCAPAAPSPDCGRNTDLGPPAPD